MVEVPAHGFYTEEERINGRRTGFMMKSPAIVLGSVALGGDDFIRKIKERRDLDIIEVTAENRNGLPAAVLDKISGLINTMKH